MQKLFNGRNYVFCLNQDLSVHRIGELLGVSEAKQADDYIKATTWNQVASIAEPEKGSFLCIVIEIGYVIKSRP